MYTVVYVSIKVLHLQIFGYSCQIYLREIPLLKAINMVYILYIVVTFLCFKTTLQTPQTVHKLEAEDVFIGGNGSDVRITDRRETSNGKVILIKAGDTAYFSICINPETNLHILDIKYSHFGEPCEISISIQKKVVYELKTKQTFTHSRGANLFMSIPRPVFVKHMRVGRFKLELKVHSAGKKGIEVDFIKIGLENKQGKGELLCKVHCDNGITYRSVTNRHNTQTNNINTPYILQNSYITKCAEEDNVNFPIFIHKPQSTKITATLPKYRTYTNKRKADFKNCAMVSSLWTFEDIIFESDDTPGRRFHKASLGPKHTKHVHGDVAALITGINAEKMTIHVQFKMEGRAIGVVDADIGSRLTMRLRGIVNNTNVGIKYKGRYDRWFKGEIKTFSYLEREHTWHIPDFTWSEHKDNYIHVEFHYPWRTLHRFVEIEIIELGRRYKRRTSFFHMFNNGKYLMEGADIDFWWLINQTMTVRILDTMDYFPEVDYFRIYSRIPWSKNHFAQIFVIYQDGYVRLLPVSPHGTDWIPFGASILIGQSDKDHPRPSAPIIHVDISMADLILHVYYKDGGYIKMQIQPKFFSTVVNIKTAELPRSLTEFPLLSFRSMWMANGNADVDHVSVDGTSYHVLLDGWKRLRGFYFAFFRKCISSHNSLSPDIVIEDGQN